MSESRDERRDRLLEAIRSTGGNRRLAAERLGISRATLYRWMDAAGLDELMLRCIAGRFDVLRREPDEPGTTVLRVRDRSSGVEPLRLELLGKPRAPEARSSLLRLLSRWPLADGQGCARLVAAGEDETSGQPYFVTDYLEPRSEAVSPPLGEGAEALEAGVRLLRALDALHRAGLVHGDVAQERVRVPSRTQHDGGRVVLLPPRLERRSARPSARDDVEAGVELVARALGEAAPPGFEAWRGNALGVEDGRWPDAGEAAEELERLLAREGALDAAASIVGREEELARIERWAHQGLQRSGAPLMLVEGEGGIGKTRVVDAALERLASKGTRVGRGNCRGEAPSALQPISEILEGLIGEDERAALARRDASAAAIVGAAGVGLGGGSDTLRSRFHVMDSLASLLESCSSEGPILLALDDLHLADAALLDFVWHLARRAKRVPLRILAAARAPEQAEPSYPPFLKGLLAEGLAETIALGRLSRPAVSRLAATTLGTARASLVEETLWRVSAGHPLFVQELVRAVLEDDVHAMSEVPEDLPGTMDEALRRRLSRVEGEPRSVLEALAVGGVPARPEELSELLGHDVQAALEELTRRRLVAIDPRGRAQMAHALFRSAMLAEIPAATRRRWHATWADRLARGDGDAVTRAGHLLAAEAGPSARRDFLAAAEALFKTWQYRAAARFFEAALERMEDDDPDRLRVMPRLARSWREARALGRVEEVYREWARVADRLGDPKARARAECALAANLRERGEWNGARRAAETAVDLASPLGDPDTGALAHKTLASILWETWRHEEAIGHLEAACELSRDAGDARAHANNLHDASLPFALMGRSAAGLDAVREARATFEAEGDRVWALLATSHQGLIEAFLGDPGSAIETARAGIDGLLELNVPVPVELAMENLVFLLHRTGRYVEAMTEARRLLDVASRSSRHESRVVALLCIGESLYHLGDHEGAHEHHRLAHDLARALDLSRQELFARVALARDHRAAGRREAAAGEAHRVFQDAARRGSVRQHHMAALELAHLALERGAYEEAQGWLDRAQGLTRHASEDGPALRAALSHLRARAWLGLGRLPMAFSAVEEGKGLARQHGPAHVEIALHALRAQVLERLDRPAEAGRAIEEGAAAVRRVSGRIDDAGLRRRFEAQPVPRALLSAATRTRGERGHDAEVRAVAAMERAAGLVSQGTGLEECLDGILSAAIEATGARRGAAIVTADAADAADETLVRGRGLEAARRDGYARAALQLAASAEGSAAEIAEPERDPQLDEDGRAALAGVRSLLCAPLRARGELLGALAVDAKGGAGFFASYDLSVLGSLSAIAAAAVHEARLTGRWPESHARAALAEGRAERCGELVSRAPSMRRVFATLRRVAPSDATVMIVGESGTGKELVARALHASSSRAEGPFLSENCALGPESLLESTLFGYVRGAFTGADEDTPGLFERAAGGTLLLDEIGEMSPALQSKLLRVLQEKEYRPVGAKDVVKTDVRVVTATHRDLLALIEEGRFREDLYYRLNVLTLRLPPLRERPEDVPLLVQHVLERFCAASGRRVPRVGAGVLRALVRYPWPGNVRELENVVHRVLLLEDGDEISLRSLAQAPELSRLVEGETSTLAAPSSTPRGGPRASQSDERSRLERALAQAGGHRGQAASLLGMSRATLYRRMKSLGLLG